MFDRRVYLPDVTSHGSYGWADQECDHQHEQEVEYFCKERQKEDGIPEELHLDENVIGKFLFDCTNHSAYFDAIKDASIDAMEEILSDITGLTVKIQFDGVEGLVLTAPVIMALYRLCDDDEQKTLRGLLEIGDEKPTSAHGHPLTWDDDKLQCLVNAAVKLHTHYDDYGDAVMMHVLESGETTYMAHSEAVDWDKFDKLCDAERDKLRAEAGEDIIIPTPRCPYTADLFEAA